MRGTSSAAAALLFAFAGAALAQQATNGSGPGWTVLASHRPAVVAELEEELTVTLPEEPSDDGFVRAMTIFAQPRSVVMELLTDYARQTEFQTDLVGFEIVEPLVGGGVIAEHKIRILFRSLSYRVVHRHDPEKYRISWALDPSHENDLMMMRGFWELHVLDANRTLGLFGTRVMPSGGLPESFARRVSRLKVPENIEQIRVWVNREGDAR